MNWTSAEHIEQYSRNKAYNYLKYQDQYQSQSADLAIGMNFRDLGWASDLRRKSKAEENVGKEESHREVEVEDKESVVRNHENEDA